MGVSRLVNEPSPSSSEESSSPTELTSYRRLGDRLASGGGGCGRNGEERAPLIKRLALGLSGALLQPSDDDSTPLVADTPTTYVPTLSSLVYCTLLQPRVHLNVHA